MNRRRAELFPLFGERTGKERKKARKSEMESMNLLAVGETDEVCAYTSYWT